MDSSNESEESMKRFLETMESQNRRMQRHYLGLGFVAAVILFVAGAISIPPLPGFSSHGMAERKLDERDKLDQILKAVASVKRLNKKINRKMNALERNVTNIVDTMENVAETVEANQETLDALLSCACHSTPPPTTNPTPNPTTAVEIDEIWEELLALDGVNWAYRARDSKSDADGTSAASGDAVVSISAAGNDIPSVNELAYLGKNYSSMQLYYAKLGASPTFVNRGDGDEYIRFINGPASNYETNPGQLHPYEAVEEDFHMIHLFRAMPGASYEVIISGSVAWKDRSGDGHQIQFYAPGVVSAALGPSGAVTVMGTDNIVDIRLFAASGIAEFRLNGDLLVTTAYSNTTGMPELTLGTKSHVMANHFRAMFINRGAHFNETELVSIGAKTDRLWPRGELPTFPYLSDAYTNRATTWDSTQYIWSPVVSGFSGGNGVEGYHMFQWYYWDKTLAVPAGLTFTENNPLRSHLAIPGATGASLNRSAYPDVFVRPGDGSVRIMRVVTPRDSNGMEGELLVGEWAYDNII